jgi:hypothetical protein
VDGYDLMNPLGAGQSQVLVQRGEKGKMPKNLSQGSGVSTMVALGDGAERGTSTAKKNLY